VSVVQRCDRARRPEPERGRVAEPGALAQRRQCADVLEQRRESGLPEDLVVGGQVAVVRGAAAEHSVDEFVQVNGSPVCQHVAFVLAVGVAIGLDLDL
jgi:hypothetical protein